MLTFLKKLLLIIGCAACFNCSSQNPEKKVCYGVSMQYVQGKEIVFPDFTLTYLGERKLDAPQSPRGYFLHRDFSITSEKEQKTISWSSGTGDLAPTDFTVANLKFSLELSHSDKLGQLGENQLVIWKML